MKEKMSKGGRTKVFRTEAEHFPYKTTTVTRLHRPIKDIDVNTVQLSSTRRQKSCGDLWRNGHNAEPTVKSSSFVAVAGDSPPPFCPSPTSVKKDTLVIGLSRILRHATPEPPGRYRAGRETLARIRVATLVQIVGGEGDDDDAITRTTHTLL